MKNFGDISNSYILFELSNTSYAIKSSYVKQLEMFENITPVPNAPPFIEGIMFIRGSVIPVINLRKRFGFPVKEVDMKTRIIVLKVGKREIGLMVDSSREFVIFEDEMIQPVPEIIKNFSARFLSGSVSHNNKLILILNVEELINITEQIEKILEIKETKHE